MAGANIVVSMEEMLARLGRMNMACENPGPLLETIAFNVQESTVRRFSEGVSPRGQKWPAKVDGSPSHLQGATNELSTSVRAEVRGTTIVVGSDKIYARIHQFGGPIKAKPGKFLHIPLNEEARREGPRRMYSRGMFKIIRGDKGVAATRGSSGELVPWFALKKEVLEPQREWLGLSDDDWSMVKDITADYAAGALR